MIGGWNSILNFPDINIQIHEFNQNSRKIFRDLKEYTSESSYETLKEKKIPAYFNNNQSYANFKAKPLTD